MVKLWQSSARRNLRDRSNSRRSLGDHSQALKWLERSADLREFQVLNLAVNPAFVELRNDPGFQALVKRIGLT